MKCKNCGSDIDKGRELCISCEYRGGSLVGGRELTCWPMTPESLAVHPDQVQEANERNKRHGISVEYDARTGIPTVPDKGNYAKLLRVEGFFNRGEGYHGA